MYSYRTSEKESKKCKGIKKCVVRKTMTFKDYKNCLFGGETSYRSQLMLRSSLHKIQALEVNKIALNEDDDKRITIDGVSSLARGHHKLNNAIKNGEPWRQSGKDSIRSTVPVHKEYRENHYNIG